MKRYGTIIYLMLGFIAGISFVYSCGGGGSSASAVTINDLEARVAALEAKLAYVTVDDNPINGVSGPNIVFSGVNIHVRNGAGVSNTANGLGNIIIGYNETSWLGTANRTGSHNLIIGRKHQYTGYDGLVAGFSNRITGAAASVCGGTGNSATNDYASVTGGGQNEAAGQAASIAGGQNGYAAGDYASIGGGYVNKATGMYATVAGGYGNSATAYYSAVSGGHGNLASGSFATVNGGNGNTASGNYASVSGGNGNAAPAAYQFDGTPDYDSGWISMDAGTSKQLQHNLGGDPADYAVQMIVRVPLTGSISNMYVGHDYLRHSPDDGNYIRNGTYWSNLNATSISVVHESGEPGLTYDPLDCRIRIWANH